MKKDKRILIFSLLDTPAFGGAEQYMLSQLRFLCQQGFHILLATNNEKVKQEFLNRLTSKEQTTFHIIHAPYRLDAIGNWKGLLKYFFSAPFALFWCYLKLLRAKKDYDKVICLWPGFSDRLTFSLVVQLLKCPLIWIEIGPLEPTFRKHLGLPKGLYLLTQHCADHLITTSLSTKKSILKNTFFQEKNCTLVYPGATLFSPEEIKKYKHQAMTWRKRNKLVGSELITVIARLADENEIDMVIQAFSQFKKSYKHDNAQLLIVGDGPAKDNLEKLTHQLGLTQSVHFLGFVSETAKRVILSTSTVFVFPRAWELDGFGMTTVEALSLGIPALTSDYGPQIEIITDGKEGYRYIPHDPKDVAQKLNKMFELTSRQRAKMSKAAYERARYFSEDNSHRSLIKVLQKFV